MIIVNWNSRADAKLKSKQSPSFHVKGAVKMCRHACWDAIGESLISPGWNRVDELKANSVGRYTRFFAELRVLHCRPTGAVDGIWKNAVKNDQANYVTGYYPLFMVLKCLRRDLNSRMSWDRSLSSIAS